MSTDFKSMGDTRISTHMKKKPKNNTVRVKLPEDSKKPKDNSSEEGSSGITISKQAVLKAFEMTNSELMGFYISQATQTFSGSVSRDGLNEKNLNHFIENSLALVAGIKPQDELEMMLAVQMIGVHNLAMEVLKRGMITGQTFEGTDAAVNRTTKLVRTFTALLEALNKHRGKGHQKITVKHVTVEKGAQAIVGDVRAGGGSSEKNRG